MTTSESCSNVPESDLCKQERCTCHKRICVIKENNIEKNVTNARGQWSLKPRISRK